MFDLHKYFLWDVEVSESFNPQIPGIILYIYTLFD